MLAHEEILDSKDATIEALRRQVGPAASGAGASVSTAGVERSDTPALPSETNAQQVLQPPSVIIPSLTPPLSGGLHPTSSNGSTRRGKAPPVESFTGESDETLWEDWLPTLERAAAWNYWDEEEKLLQLAGHLKGKALQEWNLMRENDRRSFATAIAKLKEKLDKGAKKIAAQDFRHAAQRQKENILDFVHRLEKLFRRAYGQEVLTTETRDALLYGQLQEGLRLEIMQAPAVS